MSIIKGGFQRLFQSFLYLLLFCCSGIILGFYSYFLSVLADRNLHIPQWEKAVEGISGAAVIYLIFATILTCCLGGVSFFAFLAIVLDVLFCAGMIGIAVMTRDGADSCKGTVKTPLGKGPATAHGSFGSSGFGTGQGENVVYAVSLGTACTYNTASFAVAIIAALLFLCTAAMQILLVRHHRKEKRYGPGPSNNYTSGYGKWSFKRKKGTNGTATKDTELGGVKPHGEPGPTYAVDDHTNGNHTGYYTAPTGTAAHNPYGYNAPSTNY